MPCLLPVHTPLFHIIIAMPKVHPVTWVECQCLFADIADHIVFNSFLSSTDLLNISLAPFLFMDILNFEIKYFLYSALKSTNMLMIFYTISLLKFSPSRLLSFYYFSTNFPSPRIYMCKFPSKLGGKSPPLSTPLNLEDKGPCLNVVDDKERAGVVVTSSSESLEAT